MRMVYQYKVNGLHKASAQVVGELCASLENTADGLTPKSLLEASRSEDSPLHDEFEWDDGVAAELYRENQAAAIIRNIVVVSSESNQPVCRAFVNVHSETKSGTYHNIKSVCESRDMYASMLESAKREMNTFMVKYRSITQLSAVFSEMKKVI